MVQCDECTYRSIRPMEFELVKAIAMGHLYVTGHTPNIIPYERDGVQSLCPEEEHIGAENIRAGA